VASSLNPSTFGQSVTFTAVVTTTVAFASPTGNVQFQDDGTNLGGPVTLSGGSASIATSSLTTGSHSIAAFYLGDTNHIGSTGSVSQTVN
jgi:hypothetical protein